MRFLGTRVLPEQEKRQGGFGMEIPFLQKTLESNAVRSICGTRETPRKGFHFVDVWR